MKTSFLKWRICIHSTSNTDHYIYLPFKNNWCVLQFVLVVVVHDPLLCVCVCSQGPEAERGRAVFPQHSTDAGVVWSGAACCHGIVVASIKRTISCSSLTSSSSFFFLSCMTLFFVISCLSLSGHQQCPSDGGFGIKWRCDIL